MSKIALFRTRLFQFLFAMALLVGVGIAFALDSDSDGMADAYESYFGLDPASSSDAAQNYDSDSLPNAAESEIFTDPYIADTDTDGFRDGEDTNPLSRSVYRWADLQFTSGDVYSYVRPVWALDGGKTGGEWNAELDCWQAASNDTSMLYMDLDRTMLTNNLVMALEYFDDTESEVFIDLLDTNSTVVATNLYLDVTSGSSSNVTEIFALPLAQYPSACRIQLSVAAGSTPFRVFSTILYIDDDGDNLDADQEVQEGTSDQIVDTDTDYLSDYTEVIETGTDPLDPDTDGDGLSDGEEVLTYGTSPTTEAWLDGGVAGLVQIERWYPITGLNFLRLIHNARFGTEANELAWSSSTDYDYNVGDKYGSRMRGTLTAPEDGEYTFCLTGDDAAQAWLSETESPYDRKLLIELGAATGYQDLTSSRVSEVSVTLSAGQACYLEVLHLEYLNSDHITLWWTRPGETEPEVIGSEYLHSYAQPEDDADMDGLPDAWEIANGLDPNDGTGGGYTDTDGDTYSDLTEYQMGYDPQSVDADADGLKDNDELGITLTDPAVADSDADGVQDRETLLTLNGIDISSYYDSSTKFAWTTNGTSMMLSKISIINKSSYVEYEMNFPESGMFQLVIEASWSAGVPGSALRAQMAISVDGVEVETVVCDDWGQYTFYTPLLTAGTHTIKCRPTTKNQVLGTPMYVENLTLSAIDGTDDNANGFADWMESRFVDGSDADGDGLTDEYEALNSRYQLLPEKVVWSVANGLATNYGGHLAVITSEEEHNRLVAALDDDFSSIPWIGLNADTEDGNWAWMNGETFDYTCWAASCPRANWGVYANYNSSGTWVDNYLSSFHGVLIEYEAPLDPLNPDSDDDGLSDGDEMNVYLTSPYLADTDGDGLADGDEISFGSDPRDADSDDDGCSDLEEKENGCDPNNPDTDGDGLGDQDEWLISLTNPDNADSNSNGIPDRVDVLSILGADFDLQYYDNWSTTNGVAVVDSHDYGPWVEYELNVPESGMFHLGFHTVRDGGVVDEIYEPHLMISIDGYDVEELRPCIASETLPPYSLITPWLVAGSHALRVQLLPGDKEFDHGDFEIHSVELGAIDGDDADGNGIDDWMDAVLAQGGDFDGDGLSDLDEITLYGSSPLSADTDGDGLEDSDEVLLGTDMLNADTDGDGVTDGQEVLQIYTDPGAAEFDGTVTLEDSVSGATTNAVLGEWAVEGTELVSESVRGYVEYTMDFPSNDLCRLTINAAHNWSKSSCSPAVPQDTSAFLVYVDEAYVGKVTLVSADSVYVDVQTFLPVMPAGEHIVKLYWENVHSRLAVSINELSLESLGGSDNNNNGTKDWVEVALGSIAGVDDVGQASQPAQSYVSPLCIEGDAKYVEFMEIVGQTGMSAPHKGAGDRWYANLPLEDGGSETTATASFQNGAVEEPINVTWVPYNMLDHNGATLTIRKGDALRLTCIDPDRAFDDLEHARGGQFVLNVSGTQYSSPNTRPITVTFTNAGTINVNGTYTKGNSTISAAINVQVIDGSFPTNAPACCVGKERTWSFEGMPEGIVYEVDDTVELNVEATPSSLTTVETLEDGTTVTNQPSLVTKVSLLANDTNGDHIILARLYDGGPILDSSRLSPFWIQNAVDGYFWTVERYEDSELWEIESVAKNVPDSVDIQIKVIIAGVTLDDYTLERWITNEAYDEIGEYSFRLFHPNDVDNSTCHTFKLYQDGALIGAAYSGGQDVIKE
jgi:hypothetical protein